MTPSGQDELGPGTRRPVWLATVLWPKLRVRTPLGQRIGRAVLALVGLAIAVGVYAAARWFLQLCYEVEVVGPLLCRRLLDVVLLVLLSVLFLSNVVSALSSFFLSRDLDLLVAAPVPPRVMFAARMTEQVVQSSWMVLAFGLPLLLAFAAVAGTARTYLLTAVVLPPLLWLPAIAAVVLTLLLVRLLPAARVRGIVVAFVFVGFIVLYVLVRLFEPERMMNPDGFASMVTFLASFSAPSGRWLPSHWATQVLAGSFRDAADTRDYLLPVLALWTSAGAAHAGASALFRWIYPVAFSRSQQAGRVARLSRLWARVKGERLPAGGPLRTPQRRGASVDPVRILGALMPRGATREFLIKDLKLLARDASQWSQLVLLVALVFVYLYNFRHFRQIGEAGLVGPFALYLIGLILSAFVTTAVSVRFAYPLISMEGRMLWLLYSAPIQRRQILRSKLLSTLPPLLIVAEIMSIASARILGVTAEMTVLSALLGGMNATAVAAMSTGIGALTPDYRAESSAKVAASLGGLVCMTAALAVAFALVAWAGYPAWLLYRGETGRTAIFVGCAAGALATTGLAVWLPLRLGSAAMRRQVPN
jgi:ABC-2 type transport system permease protein